MSEFKMDRVDIGTFISGMITEFGEADGTALAFGENLEDGGVYCIILASKIEGCLSTTVHTLDAEEARGLAFKILRIVNKWNKEN